jgi:hypothetical protein
VSDGLKIHIDSEADDAMLRVLAALCDLSVAVTITFRTGSERGVVLISASLDGLIVEEWDDEHEAPSGHPDTVPLDTVAKITVT